MNDAELLQRFANLIALLDEYPIDDRREPAQLAVMVAERATIHLALYAARLRTLFRAVRHTIDAQALIADVPELNTTLLALRESEIEKLWPVETKI